jgi:hypothetical protein
MAPKIKERSTRFRSGVSRGMAKQGRHEVDRENKVIFGFSVMTIGECLGHDCYADETTLKQIVEFGNAPPNGVKTRFTHPGMSSDGMGKFLGRDKNFYIEGNQVFADKHLSPRAFKTPSGDLGTYVMDLAESDPDMFGTSVVIKQSVEHQLNADGTRKKDATGKPLLPLLRVKKLFAVDVVDDPAANPGGFFSAASDAPDWAARQATEVMDRLFGDASADVVQARVNDFMNRYLANKGKAMSTETSAAGNSTAATTTPRNHGCPVCQHRGNRHRGGHRHEDGSRGQDERNHASRGLRRSRAQSDPRDSRAVQEDRPLRQGRRLH